MNWIVRQPACLAQAVWLLGLLTWAAPATAQGPEPSSQPPNIVVIYADDQGYGDVSALNSEAKFRTEHLDRLAREGLAFTNAHSPDTVCTPSRYGLLTGRYCWRTTRKTGVMGAEGPCLIADGRLTLPSLLRSRGYRTGMVGKWHLGMQMPGKFGSRDWTRPWRDGPLDKGFEHFFGIPASLNFGILAWFDGRRPRTPPTLYTGKKPNRRHVDYRIMPPYQPSPEAASRALDLRRQQVIEVAPDFVDDQCLTRFTEHAVEWIRRQSEAADRRPFFLYLALTSPHYPVCPRPEFHGQGSCGGYGEFMLETDHRVGQVMQALRDAEVDRNTLVVFTSDNGPERSYQQRAAEFGHRSNGPFRGGKRDIYEGGHRVPLLIRWPDGIRQPGRTCNELVGQVDLLATVAELVGQPLPADAGEDSQSFAMLLRRSDAEHRRAPLINHGARGRFSITDGDWKLVLPHRRLAAELYYLADDPAEAENIAAEHPQRVAEMQRRMTEIVCRGRTTDGPPQSNDTGYWDDLAWLNATQYQAQHGRN